MGKYEQLSREIGALIDTKQEQYGDSFGKAGQILRVLYPQGIMPHQAKERTRSNVSHDIYTKKNMGKL